MNLLLIGISAALINNFVLSRFLGICPFLGVSKKVETALGMGLAVTFVMTLASAVCFMINRYLLIDAPDSLIQGDLSYLYTIAFILVIASLVQVVEMFIKKSSPTLYKALGVYLPLITTNCAVLGVCVLNKDSGYNFIESVVNGFGGAIGFLIAIVLYAGIREAIEKNDIPEHFRGFPIALITAGLMSIAFMGFSGLIK